MSRELFLAHRVRELRERLDMTQEDFAQHVGVTFTTINRWENGKTIPNRIATRVLLDIERKAKR